MGREVRRVPANWEHPKHADDYYPASRAGKFIPMEEGGPYAERAAEWDEEFAKWQAGFVRSYEDGKTWVPKEERHTGRYSEWCGIRPSPDDFMPDWPEEQRTHLMMYENTSEGTPISPAFETPEDLARWLTDNEASAFGNSTATYEQWLAVAKGGWAPSAVVQNGEFKPGVAILTETDA